MRITKSKIIRLTKKKLAELGFQEFKDTQCGTSGLFIKLAKDAYFLSLGIILSNYYEERFTGSFYLSKTARWGSVWGDIPQRSYQRIGQFLTQEEKSLLLHEEHRQYGVVDAWWNGNNDQEIDKFLKAVEITQDRFLSQNDLIHEIDRSVEVQKLEKLSSSVMSMFTKSENIQFGQTDFKCIPKKSVDNVPLDWFKVAEIVLIEQKGVLNVNTVKQLAVDAWRQFSIRQNQVDVFDNR